MTIDFPDPEVAGGAIHNPINNTICTTSGIYMHVHTCIMFIFLAKIIGKLKRQRCGICQNCQSSDCGKCKYCLDKPKFSGSRKLRQCCVNKKCQQMIIPKGI